MCSWTRRRPTRARPQSRFAATRKFDPLNPDEVKRNSGLARLEKAVAASPSVRRPDCVMNSPFAKISAEIYRLRKCGVVHVYFAHRDDDRSSVGRAADVFVSRRGFTPCQGGWEPISRDDVLRVWKRVLHRDLAYKGEIMPETDAESLAAQFLTLFDSESAVYLTNCPPAQLDQNACSWSSISTATFDSGAIAMDAKNIGMIWVEDED